MPPGLLRLGAPERTGAPLRPWGVLGAASRSASVTDALREQDLRHAVVDISPTRTRVTVPALHNGTPAAEHRLPGAGAAPEGALRRPGPPRPTPAETGGGERQLRPGLPGVRPALLRAPSGTA